MSNGKTKPTLQTYLWGERGLVTAFFLDLAAVRPFERWEAFLCLIKFQRPGALKAVWCVVEPDFGNKGFGHPDVVARLAFEGGQVAVLLMEAKLTTYNKASWPSNRRARKKYNSKLNGQIELNHRLALALETHPGGQGVELKEPDWVAGTQYVLTNGRPRSLKDEAAIRLVAAELVRRRAEEYHHIIITTDDKHPGPGMNRELRPLIVAQQGASQAPLNWDQFLPRFLHCNWAGLAKLASEWDESLFRTNYNFFGKRLQDLRPPDEGVGDERLSFQGVMLVAPNASLLARVKRTTPTYLHLSWKNHGKDKSFNLRDYSTSTEPVPVPFDGEIAEVLDNSENQIPFDLGFRIRYGLDVDSNLRARLC
jgi:hypothetical protein